MKRVTMADFPGAPPDYDAAFKEVEAALRYLDGSESVVFEASRVSIARNRLRAALVHLRGDNPIDGDGKVGA